MHIMNYLDFIFILRLIFKNILIMLMCSPHGDAPTCYLAMGNSHKAYVLHMCHSYFRLCSMHKGHHVEPMWHYTSWWHSHGAYVGAMKVPITKRNLCSLAFLSKYRDFRS